MRTQALLLLSLTLSLGACGSDPVASSSPVRLSLKAKSDDVKSGVITESKDITTEIGNPFGAFIKEATNRLGVAPERILLTELSLFLGASSKGVATLEGVFSGQVDVLFEMNDTKNTYAVGSFNNFKGPGPLAGSIGFDFSKFAAVDADRFRSGSFKVVLRGNAASSFGTPDKAEAELEVGLVFEAYTAL